MPTRWFSSHTSGGAVGIYLSIYLSIYISIYKSISIYAIFCLVKVRDHFCSTLDHTALGITARIAKFEALLRSKDPGECPPPPVSVLAVALDPPSCSVTYVLPPPLPVL